MKLLRVLVTALLPVVFLIPRPALATTDWIQISTVTQPAARYGHVAILDPPNRRMILFGGTDGSTWYNDVWQLSLPCMTWSQLYPSGPLPPARAYSSVVYDLPNRRMVIFGGQTSNGVLLDSTWALGLDNLQWSKLSPSGTIPCARRGATAIYTITDSSLYLFGGEVTASGTDVGNLGITAYSTQDTWRLTLPTSGTPSWSLISPSNPGADPNMCLCADVVENGQIGGPGHACPNQPEPRGFAASIYDPRSCDGYAGRFLLLDGWDPQDDENLYNLNCRSFSQTSWLNLGGVPYYLAPPLEGIISAVYDSVSQRMIAFGASDGSNPITAQLQLSGTPAWSTISTSTSPGIHQLHTAVYDPVLEAMIVFGGRNGIGSGTALNTTWVLKDDRAPNKVTNLDVKRIGSGYVTLKWTAPEEDSTAAAMRTCFYEIRYSTSTLTDGNFGSANLWSAPPTPGTPGTEDTVKVTPLSNNTSYYFALKSTDGFAKTSFMSNVTCARPPSSLCDGGGESARLDVDLVRLAIQSVEPNPSRSGCTLFFTLGSREPAQVDVYDVAGRKVWAQRITDRGAASRSLSVPLSAGSSGYYLVRLRQGEASVTRSFVLLR